MKAKKIISLLLSVGMLSASANISAEEASPQIEVKNTRFSVTAKVTTAKPVKKITAMIKSDKAEDTKIYGMDEVTTCTSTDNGYVTELTFSFPTDSKTGTYKLYIGHDVNDTESFLFVNPLDKTNFLNALDQAKAEEVYALLEKNAENTTCDLSLYLTLKDDKFKETLRGYIDSAIAALDLAATEDTADEKDKLLKDTVAELMRGVSLVTAKDETSFETAAKTLIQEKWLDGTYFEKVNAKTVYKHFHPKEIKGMDQKNVSLLFDGACLMAVAEELDYLSVKNAYAFYGEREVVTLSDAYRDAKDAGKLNSVFRSIKDSIPTDLEALIDAVDDLAEDVVEDSDSQSPSSGSAIGSGGGASGGGGGSSRPSSSGGTIISSNANPDNVSDTNKPATGTVAEFYDVPQTHWAYGAVKTLAEKGVLSGDGNGSFRPDDTMTREEFVKLVVTAFSCEDNTATVNFADVSVDRWSYSYIASAYRLGIVSGKDAQTFDPTGSMTREDMAVILLRTAKLAGISLTSANPQFADTEEISDYAKNAVGTLCASGYLNGMGDNTYAPRITVTRAQAAKAVYEMISAGGAQ